MDIVDIIHLLSSYSFRVETQTANKTSDKRKTMADFGFRSFEPHRAQLPRCSEPVHGQGTDYDMNYPEFNILPIRVSFARSHLETRRNSWRTIEKRESCEMMMKAMKTMMASERGKRISLYL